MQAVRAIDYNLYSKEALNEGFSEYESYCMFQTIPLNKVQVELQIRVKEKHKAIAREVILEFLNYILDRSAQIRLEMGV